MTKYFHSVKILVIISGGLFMMLVHATNIRAQEIPRDNYFTIESAAEKVRKSFPDAKVVDQFELENVISGKDIIYRDLNGRKLHLDYFIPKRRAGKLNPGVLMIHGGGWRSGDRSMEIPMAQQLAGNGFAAVTVEYRLSPEAKYPAAVEDLKAAIKWMRANWRTLNLDTNKIAAYGCSAGGHLAALLGTTNGLIKYEPLNEYKNYSSTVQAIINIDGAVDLTHPEESFEENPEKLTSVGRWLGCQFNEKPELWMEVSPINYVNEKTPPVIFINSSLPEYHVGRDYMIEKLIYHKIYYEVRTIPKSPHTIWLFYPWFEETKEFVINFLKKVFIQ